MIVCPKCELELNKTDAYYICSECAYKALIRNGIVFFNPEITNMNEDYDSEALNYLYKYEQKHFWFLHRKKIIAGIIKKYVKNNQKIIEMGAGTGDIARMLLTMGYTDMSVGEMHINGLEYAKTYGISNLYQFDILKAPFVDEFDAICMFDVLEHIEKDELALKNAAKMLKNGGRIILTVPAHKCLWSNVDDNSGHKRRYTKKMIYDLIEKTDFKLLYISHFFFLIFPFLYLRAVLNKKKYKFESTDILADKLGLTINPFVNGILNFICKIEFGLFKILTFNVGREYDYCV